MSIVLELTNLAKTFRTPERDVSVASGLSLSVATGEFVAIQGASGCGKTTLLLMAGGLLAPDAGEVLWQGENVYDLSPGECSKLRRGFAGFVFQQFHLLPYLDSLDNVVAAGGRASRSRAGELLTGLGLGDRLTHLPGALSTGQCQRVALARALVNNPRLILADEPTGNLDEESSALVMAQLRQFSDAGGAVLLVTHSSQTASHAHRRLHLSAGSLTDAAR